MRRRITYLLVVLVVILAGLAIRHRGFGIPWPIAKYGGSMLWAAMVYLWLRVAVPAWPVGRAAILAVVVALLVELSRLYHTPVIDAFRMTTVGTLLLGRFFSIWNIAAYVAGITLIAWSDRYLWWRA